MTNSAWTLPAQGQYVSNILNTYDSSPIYSAGAYSFENSTGVVIASATNAGAWTLGPSGNTGSHIINGSLAINRNGSSANPGITFVNSTSPANSFALYYDNLNALGYGARTMTFLSTTSGADSVIGCVTLTGTWKNTAAAWSPLSSDARLKTDVIEISDGLQKITSLRPVHYKWINPELHVGQPTTNFLAQEVQIVNPNWVTEGDAREADAQLVSDNPPLTTSLGADFNAYLVAAIQELNTKIEAQAEQITSLESRIKSLESK